MKPLPGRIDMVVYNYSRRHFSDSHGKWVSISVFNDKVYLCKQNVQYSNETECTYCFTRCEKYSVYSVHAGFAFYTLLLGKIFLESMLKKVCFLNRIKIAHMLSNLLRTKIVPFSIRSFSSILYH
jgi:hypothetical protein